jgi:hypothetical protein
VIDSAFTIFPSSNSSFCKNSSIALSHLLHTIFAIAAFSSPSFSSTAACLSAIYCQYSIETAGAKHNAFSYFPNRHIVSQNSYTIPHLKNNFADSFSLSSFFENWVLSIANPVAFFNLFAYSLNSVESKEQWITYKLISYDTGA